MIRVDCQTHVFPKAYAELLLQNTTSVRTVRKGDAYVVSYGDLQRFALGLDPYDPDRKIRDMDAAGIDIQVLGPPPSLLYFGLKAGENLEFIRRSGNERYVA